MLEPGTQAILADEQNQKDLNANLEKLVDDEMQSMLAQIKSARAVCLVRISHSRLASSQSTLTTSRRSKRTACRRWKLLCAPSRTIWCETLP